MAIGLPVPKRYNPVAVKLGILSTIAPVLDPDFDETIGGLDKQYTEVVTEAQVSYVKKDEIDRSLAGNADNTIGHLTFTTEVLEDAGLDPTGANTLKVGDKVTEIADFAADFKVNEVRPAGHLRGKANLVLVFF